MTFMKAAVLEEMKKISVQTIEVPMVAANEVLIRVHCIGVCGSDIHYYEHGRIGNYIVEKPIILGHELAGTIAQLGSEVTGFEIGDRVAVEPGVTCGTCSYCKQGRYNLCPKVVFMATPPIDGAWAEYVTIRADFIYKLPVELSFEDGAMLDRLRAYQGDKQVLVLLNKSDRGCVMEQASFAPFPLLIGSVKEEGEALRKRLSDEIEARFLDGRLTAGQDAMITNARQLATLSAAADALARGGEALSNGLPRDLVGLDLEQALSCLLETDGRGTSDQIVNEIFSRFCVGK